MISLGTRDARKGLGLGFGGGGGNSPRSRDMDDTELEEGEAYSYHNNINNHRNDDEDASIDPDVALSYIDEKLQDVLGHFQKDFEGGVSAENLGAKFGGYGSFLPTYQRSPAWSQRTPPKVQSYSASRSPNNFHLEGGHCNSVVSSTAPQSVGRGPASTSSTSRPIVKISSMNESGKQEIAVAENRLEESAPRFDSKTKKSSTSSDRKTLKVRIKVGSDNLSMRKNAAIYTGLGLDDSPSSSMDDSPSESEGISHERQDVSFESPTSILQIMTSFPVHGGLLLSPLNDSLINLMERENFLKEGRNVPFPRAGMETCNLINGSDTKRNDGKIFGEKNVKPVEKNDHSAESKSGNDKDVRVWESSRKDLDPLACEELVSNTLKLPILSNSYSTTGDLKRSREFSRSILKDDSISDRGEEKQMEPAFSQEDRWVDKRKANAAAKVVPDGKEFTAFNEVAVHSSKYGQLKGEKIHDAVKSDLSASKVKKALKMDAMDSLKQKTNKKVEPHDENTRLPRGKDDFASEEKKKLKGSHSILAAEVAKESLKSCSVTTKPKKSVMEYCMSVSEVENGKSYKDPAKTIDTYKHFFGEMEEEDDKIDLMEAPADNPKESDTVAKSRYVVNGVPKERPSGKRIEKPSAIDGVIMTSSSPRVVNGLVPVVAQPTTAPVLIKDNWVNCDKCLKWRLLPIGTNPDHLPEKWLCSMLDWLPGMNRCCFSEEETNNALAALYHAPIPDSQTNLHSNPGGFSAGGAFANLRHPDQNPPNFSGKKKTAVKVMTNSSKDCSTQSAKVAKKTIQASAKSRSLSEVGDSPLINESDLQHLSKSNELITENHKHKYKEKNKGSEPHVSAGDSKNLKTKSRRDSDLDSSRSSKKVKTEVKNISDEGWASDHSGANGKLGPSLSGGFPTTAGKDRAKYCDRSFSKDSKSDVNDMVLKVKVKDEVSMGNGSLDIGNTETRDNLRKQKFREFQNVPNGMPFVKEEFSDNDYKKEKKPRISRSEEKESSANKGHGRSDKKRSHSKTPQPTQDIGITQQNTEGLDLLKRDLGSRQASLAAHSSSSKVSGSHKTKSSIQDAKGSPVESVSSSPLRISVPDKLAPGGGDIAVNDEFQHAGNFATHSLKRSSDGNAVDHKVDTHRGSLQCPEQDFQHVAGSKAKMHIVPSPDTTNHRPTNISIDISGQDTQRHVESEHFTNEEGENEGHNANGSYLRKPSKGSSSKSDKSRSFRSDSDAASVKVSDVSEPHDRLPSAEVKVKDGKKKFHEKLGAKSEEIEEKISSRKDVSGKQSSDVFKRESQSNGKGPDAADNKVDAVCQRDVMKTPKPNLLTESNDERYSKRLVSVKTDQPEPISGGERSALLPPSGGSQAGTSNRLHSGTVLGKGSGAETSQVDASDGENGLKVQKQIRKDQRSQHGSSRQHPPKNGHRARDIDVPSPARRDLPSYPATHALKEAKDLKHMADRLKSAGSSHEGTGLYFQAALKFLQGASLLETGCGESSNNSDMVRSRQTYSETAKLCQFCAYEYEKSKDMAAAALAYKCTEVAYMRVVYSSHAIANRDRHELQTTLLAGPPGESPSSSASDIDNLNNHAGVDKAALPKGVSSPQVATNHVIPAKHRHNFVRLLNFAQDVNLAMEASKKSWAAFAVASGSKTEPKPVEAVSSVKRVLDFSYHDIDELLPLVRVAMETIGR